jgi:hypothetical protein
LTSKTPYLEEREHVVKLLNNGNVLEKLLILRWRLVKRMIDANISSPPVITTTRLSVPVIFTNHGEFRIERYPYTGISWELERSSVVKRPHD